MVEGRELGINQLNGLEKFRVLYHDLVINDRGAFNAKADRLAANLKSRYRLKEDLSEIKAMANYMVDFNFDVKDLPRRQILDVGSAHGNFRRIAEKISTAKVTNVDDFSSLNAVIAHLESVGYSGAALDAALREHDMDEVLASVDYKANVDSLPFEDGKYDIVFARAVFGTDGYKGNMETGIRELIRVAKRNGIIGIAPFNFKPPTEGVPHISEEDYVAVLNIIRNDYPNYKYDLSYFEDNPQRNRLSLKIHKV